MQDRQSLLNLSLLLSKQANDSKCDVYNGWGYNFVKVYNPSFLILFNVFFSELFYTNAMNQNLKRVIWL
jgi:hypothetical protein